jgi:hypothetical protein
MSTDTLQVPALADAARAKLPNSYEAAKQALAACADLDECKDWADKAAATAAYARMADDRTLFNYAHRIQARAVRQIGELIKLIPSAQGQRPPNGGAPIKSLKEQARIAAGLSKDQVNTAVRVANIPKESFEEQVEAANPPNVTELARQGTQHRPQPAEAQPVEGNATVVLAQKYIAAVVDLLRKMSQPERLEFRSKLLAAMSDEMLNAAR